jgi:hypothetical protein
MSSEAVQNLNQHIRVGTARDGAESCCSKTLRWTAGLRKYRTLPDVVDGSYQSVPVRFLDPEALTLKFCVALVAGHMLRQTSCDQFVAPGPLI